MPRTTSSNHHTPLVRTCVRLCAVVVVALAGLVGAVVMSAAPVRAVPLPEHSTEWIARSAFDITTELRRAQYVPSAEQREVAQRSITELASLVAYHLDADPLLLRRAWLDAPLQRKIVVFAALSQLGVPYELNGDAPFIGLDCSALTRYAWGQAGVNIDRASAFQYARARRVRIDHVRAGDLVWYPGHIMMSLGVPELIVHARSGARTVEIHRIAEERLDWMRWVDPTNRP